MDINTPTNPPSKRARAKVSVQRPAAAKPVRKTGIAPRKKSPAATASAVEPKPVGPADLHGEIQQTAFYLAAERHFAAGHELDDWLEAERRIKALHSA